MTRPSRHRVRARGSRSSSIGAIVGCLESEKLVKWSLGAFLLHHRPDVAMRWHLAATESLTQGEKRTWRYVSGWGGFGFMASSLLSHAVGPTAAAVTARENGPSGPTRGWS